ncbi:MAG TPA: DUF1440 domain-containing protein [Candidatus Binatia bacterium]|nr:DUF1440 domain-containing protein [Candidatus Binatia bacterium]
MPHHHTITMDQLHDIWRRARGRLVVVDVRTAEEYGAGHVPDSRNLPIDEIRRRPAKVASEMRALGHVYIHCSTGVRAEKAFAALRAEGADNLTVIVDSGMEDWMQRGYPISRGGAERTFARDLVVGIGAGLLASAVVGPVDRAFERYVGPKERMREGWRRSRTPHWIIGSHIGDGIGGRRSQQLARLGFAAIYAAGWGLMYATARRKAPGVSQLAGLPFAGAMYALLDGVIAPALELAPPPTRLPWQRNVEEMGNHLLWTATAEMVHRAAEPPALR